MTDDTCKTCGGTGWKKEPSEWREYKEQYSRCPDCAPDWEDRFDALAKDVVALREDLAQTSEFYTNELDRIIERHGLLPKENRK